MTKTTSENTRDGRSPAKAVVEDQNAWRRRNCPGFTMALQRLMVIDDKSCDVLTLASPARDEIRIVYFDVSHLFARDSTTPAEKKEPTKKRTKKGKRRWS